jgi:hypothetical protein
MSDWRYLGIRLGKNEERQCMRERVYYSLLSHEFLLKKPAVWLASKDSLDKMAEEYKGPHGASAQFTYLPLGLPREHGFFPDVPLAHIVFNLPLRQGIVDGMLAFENTPLEIREKIFEDLANKTLEQLLPFQVLATDKGPDRLTQ